MGLTINLGRRLELVSMDPHFYNVSISLYRRNSCPGLELLVHSYSHKLGINERLEFIAQAMVIIGGMEKVPGEFQSLRFPKSIDLEFAAKRVFLEACKYPINTEVKIRPLNVFDKKCQTQVNVGSLGKGIYKVRTEEKNDQTARRIAAITAGLVKLSGASIFNGHPDSVVFPQEQSNDSLVGLLLTRALNVRAVIRAEEDASTRGVLSAPSAHNN